MKTREQIFERLQKRPKSTFTLDALGEYVIVELATARFGAPAAWPYDLAGVQNRPLTEGSLTTDLAWMVQLGAKAAVGHDAIRASYGIDKLRALLWALDHQLGAWAADDANYPNYGVPIFRKIAQTFNLQLPAEFATWKDREKCAPDCARGCGL